MREEQGEQPQRTKPLACGLTLELCRTRIAKTRRQAAFKCFGRNDLPLVCCDHTGGNYRPLTGCRESFAVPFGLCQKGSFSLMTHVVCEPCFGCKYTDCVVVCPVECFYEGEKILYIHPDECIDCEACVPECPVEAIFHEDNVPEEWKPFTQLNAEMAPQCPVITEKKAPLAES
jgi:ferredoxin